jgi:hypothetical protein
MPEPETASNFPGTGSSGHSNAAPWFALRNKIKKQGLEAVQLSEFDHSIWVFQRRRFCLRKLRPGAGF